MKCYCGHADAQHAGDGHCGFCPCSGLLPVTPKNPAVMSREKFRELIGDLPAGSAAYGALADHDAEMRARLARAEEIAQVASGRSCWNRESQCDSQFCAPCRARAYFAAQESQQAESRVRPGDYDKHATREECTCQKCGSYRPGYRFCDGDPCLNCREREKQQAEDGAGHGTLGGYEPAQGPTVPAPSSSVEQRPREVVLVYDDLGREPSHVDTGSKWDAGKRRAVFVPADEAERRVKELEEALRSTATHKVHSGGGLCWCFGGFDHEPHCISKRDLLSPSGTGGEKCGECNGSGREHCGDSTCGADSCSDCAYCSGTGKSASAGDGNG